MAEEIRGTTNLGGQADRAAAAKPPDPKAEPPRHPFRMLLQGVFDGEDIGEGEPDDDEQPAGGSAGPDSTQQAADG